MMPYLSTRFAHQRMADARRQAQLARTRRAHVDDRKPGNGVIDAVGHGLIALGTRLVADAEKESSSRRAA